jgi:hypothetical protein
MAGDGLHQLAEARSLAFHRLVAERLRTDPGLLAHTRERVERWLRDGTVSRGYAEAWRRALDLPPGELAALLTDAGSRGLALRQSSPFAGAIDPRTRWRAWREARERFERP